MAVSSAVLALGLVNTAQADFPAIVQLSDLDGTNGFKIDGEAVEDSLGRAVSAAGDINGDGVDDLVLGARWADPNGNRSGRSYVVFGNANGFAPTMQLFALDGTNGVKLDGETAYDYSGRVVSAAGDINGDGVDDLFIGAYGADPNGKMSGRSYVVFGDANGFLSPIQLSSLNGINGFVIDGEVINDQSGYAVRGAGDINGDGVDDLVIGARFADPNGPSSGRSYVVFGRTTAFESPLQLSSLNGIDGFMLDGEATADLAGISVGSAGDVNGDGIGDLIVGARLADANGPNSGRSYVIFGQTGGFPPVIQLSALDGTSGFVLDGEATYDRSGASVSAAGDVNGDGIDDLIVGAYRADPNGSSSGRSYVVFGSTLGFDSPLQLSSLDGTNGFMLDGEAPGDNSGRPVRPAGDINGDGVDDLIIGADGVDSNGSASGRTYVVFGSTAGFVSPMPLSDLDGSNGFKIDGEAAYDFSGFSAGAAGDVNGDGVDDVVIGAWGADPNGEVSGRGYVVFGRPPSPFPSRLSLDLLDGTDGFRIDGAADGDRSGRSVSAAGDVSGDGIDDVIIGAPYADPDGTGTTPGGSYVVFGRETAVTGSFPMSVDLGTLTGADGFRLDGEAFARSGVSVSAAGDINGDGIDDVIVGAPRKFANGSQSGRSYVVFGRDPSVEGAFPAALDLGALDGSNGFMRDGESSDDWAGFSVSAAGDINGDGIDDVIVGAFRVDLNGLLSGSSYVVFGRDTAIEGAFPVTLNLGTLGGTDGFRLDGVEELDRAGYSVSAAGDINGDGINDLIVGAWQADLHGRQYGGSSYVVFGRDTGVTGPFPAGLNLGNLDGNDGFRVDAAAAYDYSGASVSAAGDINGDGIGDLIIGAWAADPNGSRSGSSYVVFGRDTAAAGAFPASLDLGALTGIDGFRLDGVAAGDYSGASVSAAGDINGDGIDDLIIGARAADPNAKEDAGSSYVVFGRDTAATGAFPPTVDLGSLLGDDGFRLDGVTAFDLAGHSVSAAGDINGDGIGDVIIGAPEADPRGRDQAGSSYVIFGGITGPGEKPTIGFTPAAVDFGNVEVGSMSAPQTVTIESTGTGELTLGALTFEGAAAGDYSLATDGCSEQTLMASESCDVEIGFTPSASGMRTARLRIPSNAPDGPHFVEIFGSSGVVFADGFED